MVEQKRQTSRVSSSYVLRYKRPADASYNTGPVDNLSPGGFFVTTEHRLPVGEEVEVQVKFSNGASFEKGRAKVAHIDDKRGMGFQFTVLNDELAEFLKDVVDRRLQEE